MLPAMTHTAGTDTLVEARTALREVVANLTALVGGISDPNAASVGTWGAVDVAAQLSHVLPPNGDAVSGADEIAKFWQTFSELGITEARPVTREVIPMGDYALEVGESTVYGQDGALVDRGKIMVLWKQDEDGVWKMHRDTWNSSIPPSEA